MKAKITLTFNIESSEYHSVEPTEESIRELVKAKKFLFTTWNFLTFSIYWVSYPTMKCGL